MDRRRKGIRSSRLKMGAGSLMKALRFYARPTGAGAGKRLAVSLPGEADNYESEKVKALPKQLADRVGSSRRAQWPMEALMNIALAARAADVWNFDDTAVATESEKTDLSEQTSAEIGRLVRALIAAERPRTQMPKPSEPQFFKVCIGEALAKRPILRNIGPILTPAREAANFCTKM